MLIRRILLLVVGIGALQASPAQAHFLFVRILPPAEGGRAAEVYFSELAEAGDPRFVNKIAKTELWLQQTPGRFVALKVHKATDRLRAWLPEQGAVVVVGRCVYGVVGRTRQTPFLLRHFPKALSGSPAELNKMQAHGKLPLEIVAAFEDEGIRVTVLKDGKPVPKAQFVTVDARLNNVQLTADADGKAMWRPPAAGVYSVYARDTRKEAGEAGGKKYEEIRDFATVAFTWPPQRKDADPAAVTLFEEAIAARAQWRDFPGFSARITGDLDGRRFAGTVSIDAKGEVTFSDDDSSRTEAVSGWVEAQFESLVLHRLARPSTPSRAKPVLRFAETRDDHPMGRLLIFEGGRFASSYRIRDKQIQVVNRCLGKENMTITVLENERNADGRFLPRGYVVHSWESGTGRLLRTETVRDRWRRVGSWDLPAAHEVTTATDAGLSVRRFMLSKHELAGKKP
ncbi:MAG TPA: DUF3386 family protein [Gemmataceae bacterium]|jgi:hypothetical protein